MSTKISLRIGGRNFDVDVDENFAPFLEDSMAKDFSVDGNNDLKRLLQAYIRKTFELYLQEKQIVHMIKKIDR